MQKTPSFVGYPLFGLLLCVTYILKNGGSHCFVLTVGSASYRSSMKCSAIF